MSLIDFLQEVFTNQHSLTQSRSPSQINSPKDRLRRLHEVIDDKFLENSHLVPLEDDINISKLGFGATIIPDICDAAQNYAVSLRI